MSQKMVHIRDPIHGTIYASYEELQIIDSPFFQRLRNIKQLAFVEQAFPGATHTRYSHSLGVMYMAAQVFDTIFSSSDIISASEKIRFRQIVRLAALLHDIGHAPFSHTTEKVMPQVKLLGISEWTQKNSERQATHEDYTIKIILHSDITQRINDTFASLDINAEMIAMVLFSPFLRNQDAFVVEKINFLPLLQQIVSSELDSDRMDYLKRDSFFCGVKYGQFDSEWLIHSLSYTIQNNIAYLTLDRRGIFAFEDFLLSRHHMFLSVYYHHRTVCFDNMLINFFSENPNYLLFNGELKEYLHLDDISLVMLLREHSSHWAKRITGKDRIAMAPYKMIFESAENEDQSDISFLSKVETLKEKKIDFFIDTSLSRLSKYFLSKDKAHPLWVKEESGNFTSIETYANVFQRYKEGIRFNRIYCRPEDSKKAKELLHSK